MLFVRTRNVGRAWLVAGAAVLGMLGLPGAAQAMQSGNAPLVPTTTAPSPVSAVVLFAPADPANSSNQSIVDMCFNQQILVAGGAASFGLSGYNSDHGSALPTGAPAPKVDPSNPNCAQLQFAGGVDPKGFTDITVAAGGVTSLSGTPGPAGTAALDGSYIMPVNSETTAGTLTSVTLVPGANQIIYTVNRNVCAVTAGGCTAPDKTKFFFVPSSGAAVMASSIVGVQNSNGVGQITAQFPASPPGTSVNTAQRAFILAQGYTTLAQNDKNQLDALESGVSTVGPGMNGAVADSANINCWIVSYDQGVVPGTAASFDAVLEDGTPIAATGSVVAKDSTHLEFCAPGVQNATYKVVRVIDTGGGAGSASGSPPGTPPSVPGAAAVKAPPMGEGFTDAWDLTGASKNTALSQATLAGDVPVAHGATAPGAGVSFVQTDGTLSAETGGVSVSGNSVTVSGSSGAVAGAVGMSVASGTAIPDDQPTEAGNPNPDAAATAEFPNSVFLGGAELSGFGSGGGTSTGTTTTTGTTGGFGTSTTTGGTTTGGTTTGGTTTGGTTTGGTTTGGTGTTSGTTTTTTTGTTTAGTTGAATTTTTGGIPGGPKPFLTLTKSFSKKTKGKKVKFTITGSATPPPGVSAANACSGGVLITLKKGSQTKASTTSTLLPGCTYLAHLSVKKKKLKKPKNGALNVKITFLGNAFVSSQTV